MRWGHILAVPAGFSELPKGDDSELSLALFGVEKQSHNIDCLNNPAAN